MTQLATRVRSRLSSLGIRERLVLLVLAMLLPWIALFATPYASYQRDIERDTRDRLGEIATQVGARVDDQLGTIEGILLTVAQATSLDRSRIAENDALLRRLRAQLPVYINSISVWSITGQNIGWGDADTLIARSVEVAAHRFFRDALTSSRLTVGRPIKSNATGSFTLTMARNIRHDGSLAGVASISAWLDSITRFLAVGGGTNTGTIITLVDDAGAVLARSGGEDVPVGTQI